MNGIFLSYRRDDSAGHAGRLFDGLKERFGAERVFMDMSGLRPGQDFVAALDQALANAACVLALIGPRWLDALNTAGQRRIDDPNDFVHREISAALAQGATVIPVLVHGATMPAAEALPEALRALARRQAITLSDQRWSSDLRELNQLLAPQDGGPSTPHSAAPAPASQLSSRSTWLATAALATVAAAGLAAWLLFKPASPQSDSGVNAARVQAGQPAATGKPGKPGKAEASPAATGKAGTAPLRFAVTLPPLSEVRFHTNRAQVVFTLLAIRQEPLANDKQALSFLVRMLSRGPADEVFSSDQFRLVVGEQLIAPLDFLNSITNAMEAKDTVLRFVAPAGLSAAALEVRVNAESTRIPVALQARSQIANDPALDDFGRPRPARVVDMFKSLPLELAAGQRVALGPVGYQLVAAVIERETVEKASLNVTVRCTVPLGGAAVSFGSDSVRLWLDGVPRAAVNFVNEAVSAGHSKEARFVFDLLAMPQSMELSLRNSSESSKFALPLDALPRR